MVDDREEDHQLESINRAHEKKSSLFGDHAGKLWIKLRIPKDEEAEAEGDEEEQKKLGKKENSQQQKNDVVITRICQVCNKGFKSGKALGGHMRVHFQTNKDLIFTKKLSKQSQPIIKFKKQKPERSDFAETKSPPPPPGGGGGDEVYTCSECGKIFPSAKSLFGHMRCHPDREWRGIRPPSPQPVKASPFSSVSDANQLDDYEDDDDDKVDSAGGGGDLAKLLGGWSVRAKRGRKAILGDVAAEDEEMRDAVFHLMSLANGGFCEANKKKERVNYEGFEATNSNSLAWKNGSEEVRSKKRVNNDESMKNKKKKKRKDREIAGGYMKDHPVKELRNTDDGSIDVIHVGNVKAVQETDFLAGKLNWPKEYAERKDFWDVNDDDDSDDSEKTQVVNHNQNHHYSADSSNGNLMKMMKKRKKMKLRDLDDPSSRITHQDPEKFKCTTCDKCFSTHQALGGHRSSHNKFKMVIHNALHEDLDHLEDENLMEESVDEGAGSSKLGDDHHLCKICNKRCRPMIGGTCGRRVVMEFDLNEEPPVEEDGMESSDHPPRAASALASASASASYGSSNNNNNSVEFPFF